MLLVDSKRVGWLVGFLTLLSGARVGRGAFFATGLREGAMVGKAVGESSGSLQTTADAVTIPLHSSSSRNRENILLPVALALLAGSSLKQTPVLSHHKQCRCDKQPVQFCVRSGQGSTYIVGSDVVGSMVGVVLGVMVVTMVGDSEGDSESRTRITAAGTPFEIIAESKVPFSTDFSMTCSK